MNGLRIRAGETTDASGIAAIINQEIRTGVAIWRNSERPLSEIQAMVDARLAAGHAVYVAEDAGKIIGWASYGEFRTYDGYAQTMEHSVHIAPEYQRRGIAGALMPRLLDHADAAGIHALIGAIASSNEGSIALHEKLGFTEVGRLPEVGKKFGDWLTLVLMQRTKQD